jgi:lipopolysaccharide export system protein LptA
MNRAGRVAVLAAVLGIAAAVPFPLRAQGIDLSHGGPIHVTAKGGIEWLQQQHEVIASGGATATRQNVTVVADRLIAFYRKKAEVQGSATPAKATAPNKGVDITGEDSGGNEIYRLVAEGHVVISTPTDVLTARDDLEYWSAKHMAVARGDAKVVTKDARRLSADVLVAYTVPEQARNAATPVAATAGRQPDSQDPLEGSGKLQKVEAFGHVVVSTPTEVVTGDRGVYQPDTGIAILVDHVRITRGPNQLEGSEAEVNLKTGVSRLIGQKNARVTGLIVPQQASPAQAGAAPAATPARKAPR